MTTVSIIVLVTDDDPQTRGRMLCTLDKADWRISEVGNGREALDWLAQQKSRLILLGQLVAMLGNSFDGNR